jgi:HSP20 family protein
MSIQDLLFSSLNNLQTDDDLRGALQYIINSGVGKANEQKEWQPSIDIVDLENNIHIYIELPGVIEDSISIDFFNNRLTVSGEKTKRYTSPSYKHEIVYGKFKRNIILPINVTSKDNVTVSCVFGVLTIIINKKEEQNGFRLGVK